jgi:hypothetical protein
VDVFKAFPEAVIKNVWQIGQYQKGSLVGAVWASDGAFNIDVIVDEGNNTTINYAPNSEPLTADLLLYVRPEQLPTTKTNALVSGYLVYDSVNKEFYDVIKADVGKNQNNGSVEHVEMYLRQTDANELDMESI